MRHPSSHSYMCFSGLINRTYKFHVVPVALVSFANIQPLSGKDTREVGSRFLSNYQANIYQGSAVSFKIVYTSLCCTAVRCTSMCKSFLIHRNQFSTSLPEIWHSTLKTVICFIMTCVTSPQLNSQMQRLIIILNLLQYSWLLITQTIVSLNLVLTWTKINFRWISVVN